MSAEHVVATIKFHHRSGGASTTPNASTDRLAHAPIMNGARAIAFARIQQSTAPNAYVVAAQNAHP